MDILFRLCLFSMLGVSVSAQTFPPFTNISSGTLAAGNTHCAAAADFDNDGDVDLFRGAESNALFRNDGNGTFTDVTSAAGITGPTQDTAFAIWGDFNNDGHIDLFLGGGIASFRPVQLFQNDGDGTFTDVTAAQGLTQATASTGIHNRSAGFFDFDKDGDLDLVLIIFGLPNRLFRNNGAPNFTFTDVTSEAGFNEPGAFHQSHDLTIGDFDTDDDLDIFVAGNFSTSTGATTNQLWRNNGDGTFTDIASTAGVAQLPESAQSCCSGDIDNDGDLDLLVGAFGTIALFRNNGTTNGSPSFTNVASSAGLSVSDTVVSCQFADLDFDGLLDLILGLRQFGEGSLDELKLFENTTSSTIAFSDVTTRFGTQTTDVLSVCVADFNNDNRLDVFAGSDNNGGNLLLRNDGPVGNFLKLALKPVTSNRSAIGTRILTTFNPTTRRDVISDGRSQNDLTQFIGVGTASTAAIRVQWSRGLVIKLSDVPTNRTIGIVESDPVAIPNRVTVGKTRQILLVGDGLSDFNQILINGTPVTNVTAVNQPIDNSGAPVVGVSFTAPAITTPGAFNITATLSGSDTAFALDEEGIRYVSDTSVTTAVTGGTSQSSYRIFGIAVADDDDDTLKKQFFDQLGVGDTTRSRVFNFDGTAYKEILSLDEDDDLNDGGTEGKAIWVISRDTVDVTLTGGNTSEGAVNGIANPPISVLLHTGFNLVSPGVIGNFDPDNAVVTDGKAFLHVTSTANNLTTQSFQEFTGNLASPYLTATTLNGRTGYWISNLTNQALVLFFGDPFDNEVGDNGNATVAVVRHAPALRNFLRMDVSQSSLPRSIKRAMTGNSQGIQRATTNATTPPPPPGAVTASASDNGGGGGCFIATAAYGSKLDTRLHPLRNFRDRSLLTAPVGRAFTETYYANSPTAANALRTSKTAQAVMRHWLQPMANTAK